MPSVEKGKPDVGAIAGPCSTRETRRGQPMPVGTKDDGTTFDRNTPGSSWTLSKSACRGALSVANGGSLRVVYFASIPAFQSVTMPQPATVNSRSNRSTAGAHFQLPSAGLNSAVSGRPIAMDCDRASPVCGFSFYAGHRSGRFSLRPGT